MGKDGIEELFAYARGKGVRPEDALKSEGVKAFVEVMRSKKRLADNTPTPSEGSPGTPPQKSFNELTPKEKTQGYEATVGKLIDRARKG